MARLVLGVVVVVGLGVAACGGAPGGGTVRDTGDVHGKIAGIRLAAAAGSVTVRGDARNTGTTVRRVVQYRGGKPGRSYDNSGGTLTLRDCGRQCAVDYTVDVPAGTAVTGRIEAGAIRLSRVGRVEVATAAGSIEVSSATGPVSARTQNGAIDIRLTRPGDVRAVTGNGGIGLDVPDASYRVNARVTGAGKTDIGVRNAPSAPHRLDLRTGNGDIDVH